MEIAKLILEYLKVLLTTPVLFSVIAIFFICRFTEDIKALLLRVAKIKLPGGTEVITTQSSRIAEEEQKTLPEKTEVPIQEIPSTLTPEQKQTIEQLIRAHIATAHLWEYRYLNYFLVHSTQVVLDWLIGLPQPTTLAHYDSSWLPLIPSSDERRAIINALQMHNLITYDASTSMITVTSKGREYRKWRGDLLPPANVT